MALHEQEGFIWIDGEYVPWKDATVHCLTHTLHYGMGVFEGLRAYETDDGPAIFRLNEHTNRLYRSAHIMRMELPFDKDTLNKAHLDILKKNNLTAAYLRPMVFYGAEYLGVQTDPLSTHVMIAAWPWGSYFNPAEQNKGIRAHTSTYAKNATNSSLCKAKANGNYVNSVLALQEARSNGYDEAILLDHRGLVSEGSSSNIFMVRDGVLFTPTTASILEGITRDTIMTLAREQGIDVIEKDLTRDDLFVADEVFFTGSAAEIAAVSSIDGREIAEGHRGPITQQLQELYTKCVSGNAPEHEDWLTRI